MDDLEKLLENAGINEVHGREFGSASDMIIFMKKEIDRILSDYIEYGHGGVDGAEYVVDDLYALKGVIDNAYVA